ncbi:MAG TPA: serine/threonine-protein kinase [Ktedonobacteraceae bacterium]|jgi:serine/threonine-protein kinase
MDELAGQYVGGYLLEEEIGRGSMGVIYRGKQIALGRDVAIKVLPQKLAKDPSYIARFIREAQIIAGLNHPNIVHIYDAGQLHTLLYFVMEFVQGPTLASLLSIDGTILQHMAAEYAAQIADALDAAYRERHVIHRDIKPENLMLNRWGKIKVMDFGLARASGLQTITVAKTLVGSIYYSSPEQIWGQTLDNRSDIYALGIVLYELVSGHRPFDGRSMTELTGNITSGKLQPPSFYNPELSPQLEQIILTALARDRNERYNEASLLAQDLRKLNLEAPAQPILPISPILSVSSAREPQLPRGYPQIPREQATIHPPKRPTLRPSYLNAEIPPLATPFFGFPEPNLVSTSTQPVQKEEIYGEGQASPYQTTPYHSALPSEESEIINHDTKMPTTTSDPKAEHQHGIWNQLQRLFRPPQR